MIQSRRLLRTRLLGAVDAGASINLELEGPGYYAVRRVYVARVAGALATTYQPSIHEFDPTSGRTQVIELPSTAAGTALHWPSSAPDPAPARYGYFPAGKALVLIGADVAGDSWDIVLVLERLR